MKYNNISKRRVNDEPLRNVLSLYLYYGLDCDGINFLCSSWIGDVFWI